MTVSRFFAVLGWAVLTGAAGATGVSIGGGAPIDAIGAMLGAGAVGFLAGLWRQRSN